MIGGRRTSGIPPNNNVTLVSKPIYSFPELRISEILQCMEDLRISLQESEIVKPTCQTVQRLFEAFIAIFTGRKMVDAEVSINAAAEALENPDLHIEAIGLISFFRAAQKLAIRVGINDFTLRDIIKPEAPRLKLILSGIINFAKFREEQLSLFEELSIKAEEATETKLRLTKKSEDLSVRIARIKSRLEEEEPRVEVLRTEMSQMVQRLRDLKREQSALSTEIETRKILRTEGGERTQQAHSLLGTLRHEVAKIRSRIVVSPERLQQLIAELASSVSGERLAITQTERKSRDLQMRLDALSSLEAELSRIVSAMVQLRADLNKRDELLNECETKQRSLERLRIDLKDLELRNTTLSRQINAASEKMTRLERTQDERRLNLTSRLDSLQEQHLTVVEEREKVTLQSDSNERAIKDLESRIADLRRVHESEIVALRTDCVSLKTRVTAYACEVKKNLAVPI